MQNGIQVVLLSGLVQMCGNSAPQSTYNDPDQILSCEEYQIILDVEILVGQECTADSDCDQTLNVGEDICESNSILVHASYETEYFDTLYEEALAFGCQLSFAVNQDCDKTSATCSGGICSWQ